MSSLRRAWLGLWEFVVGDDWRSAAGVVLGLALTALVADLHVASWWVMPVAVLGLLGLSIRRSARESARNSGGKAGR